jgi:four helix bundle protein
MMMHARLLITIFHVCRIFEGSKFGARRLRSPWTTHRLAEAIRGAAYLSLRSQLIRAAMSIPANIAEGREQKTERGFANFLRHALASATELENHYLIARGIKVIPQAACDSAILQTIEVKKMLHGLINTLECQEPPSALTRIERSK